MDETKQPGAIVGGFWKSWAFLSAAGALVLAYGPDIVALVAAQWDAVFPTLDPVWKTRVLLAGSVLTMITRAINQPKSFRPDEGVTVPVAIINVPDRVEMGNSGVHVETEIERVERIKTEPGPGG